MAANDVTILIGLVSFFIILGVALPFINAGFGADSTTNANVDGFANDLNQQANEENQVSIWRVLTSLLSIFFWSFGELGIIANTFLLIPRIALVVIIARNVWIGGGA